MRHHHGLQRKRGRHIELDHLLAGREDRLDAAQVGLRARLPGQLADLGPHLLVDQRGRGVRAERDGVAIDGDEIHQAAVDHVEVPALGPGLLALLQGRQGGGVLARPTAPLDHAVGRVEVGLLAGVEVAGDRRRLLLRGLDEVGRRRHRGPEARQSGRDRDHLASAVAGGLVERQHPGPADVALAGAGGVRREGLRDALGADQERGHVVGGRRGQGDQPAARPDRGQHVLGRRRAEQPHGPVGGLLDRLEQRVAGRVGQPVGVLDHEHLPAGPDRRQGRAAHELADVVDADRELLGAHPGDVGMAGGQHLAAGRARTAAGVLALERGREGHRGVGPTRSRRSGEQPRVGHSAPAGRAAEHLDQGALADQLVPDRHRPTRRAWTSSGRTRSRTAPASSSTGRRASSTR